MAGWEMKIIEAEARRLVALAADDHDLRADLRALAQEILAVPGGPSPHTGQVPVSFPDEPGTAMESIWAEPL